jgi:hypothetical protein
MEGGIAITTAFWGGREGKALFEVWEKAFLDKKLLDRSIDDEIFGEGWGLTVDIGGECLGDRVGKVSRDLFHWEFVSLGSGELCCSDYSVVDRGGLIS